MYTKTDALLQVWAALIVSHGLATRHIQKQLERSSPLSLDEYDVLLTISRSPQGQVRFSTLASATMFTRSGITRVTKRLEERGLIKRLACPEDKRGSYATLTPHGKDALRNTWKTLAQDISSLLEPCLTQSEAHVLHDLLGRIVGRARSLALVQISKQNKKPPRNKSHLKLRGGV
jgi:DNA-binding MarR family transcriptional regulator